MDLQLSHVRDVATRPTSSRTVTMLRFAAFMNKFRRLGYAGRDRNVCALVHTIPLAARVRYCTGAQL